MYQQVKASQLICEMTKLLCTKCSKELWVLVRSPQEHETIATTLSCEVCAKAPAETKEIKEDITPLNTTPEEPAEIQEQEDSSPKE